MKKYISVFAAALMVMTACSKNELKVGTASPVEMTLTATIGADTKVSFVDEDNVLKTAWEAGDKVSVVALDVQKQVISNDVFTAQSAGNTTNFTGTFTNDANTMYVRVFYPALTEGNGSEDSEETKWHSPLLYNEDFNGNDEPWVLNGVYKGKSILRYGTLYGLQKADASCSHLENYIVLSGDADVNEIKNDTWNVVLYHRSYVVKCDITFPAEAIGKKLQALTIAAYDSEDNSVQVSGAGWTDIYSDELFPGGWNTYYSMCFGESKVSAGLGSGIELTDNIFTAYFVAYAGESWNYYVQQTRRYQLTEGDYLKITARTTDGINEIGYKLSKKSVTKTTILQNGKMYRLDATLVAE